MKQIKQPTGERRNEGEPLEISKENGKYSKKTIVFLKLIVFLPCLFMILQLNNDTWFLLNSGRYVLQHGIPTIEPFTLHQNFSFVMQQWLTAVVFWVVYSRLGAAGLLALVFLLYCAIVAVTWKLSWHLSEGNPVATFLATLLTSALLMIVMVTRPTSFTLLILICELYVMERFIRSSNPAFLIPLPFLSALLINLHAAMWPMQFILLLPYIVDSFRFKFSILEGEGYPKQFFFPALALMFAAGFLNPYGWNAMTYVFRSYGNQEISFIQEMQPVNINEGIGMLIFGVFFLVLAFYLLNRERSTKLRFVLLTLGTAILTLSSLRSFAIFDICAFFPLAYLLRDVSLPEGRIQSNKNTLCLRVVLGALVAIIAGSMIIQRVMIFDEKKELPTVSSAVNFLITREPQESMRLYMGYKGGGYGEYMGLKPYIDPRAEIFVKKNNHVKDVMKEYYLLQTGQTYYKTVLDEYQFTHLIVARTDILAVYLPHDNDYQLIYEDSEYNIYRHR
ncbi:MAG: hypothetical protein VB061_14525 [Christensenella sp.]|nr:hypothetical protein [Christensenella sp.]